jgi:DNA repair protein RecN (Recombination protein N)
MLKQLYIKNFTLIDELDISFNPGFSVITGETGAGKSIILGAIGLLLGNRADTRQVKAGTERCIVEAHFDLHKYNLQTFFQEHDLDYDEQDCIVRREVSASGKSRAFINDSPVSLQQMKDLGERLVDIHSQHQNLLLRKEDFQLNVIDLMAGNERERNDYTTAYQSYTQARSQLQALKQQMQASHDNEDFLRFQQSELNDAQLTAGEQEELEEQSQLMSHVEEIKSALYESDNLLNADSTGIVNGLRTIINQLHSIENVFPAAEELASRTDECFIELKDISEEISNRLERVDFNPAELERINDRLDHLYSLQQKYHVSSVEELIDIKQNIDEQLSQIDNSDEQLKELQDQLIALESACQDKAKRLSATRQKAARKVEQAMKSRLVPLGIPNVRFEVSLSEKPLSADGTDRVAFLFSANKSTALLPVSEVASGGEIARVMLSLKAMISGSVKLPTIIFDEIDTGVSGRVAEQMAAIMKEMGDADRQVISITHLPQIAAMGATHYRVSKEERKQGTTSSMVMLSQEERISEIAQMLSGSNISEAAISNAKALLQIGE